MVSLCLSLWNGNSIQFNYNLINHIMFDVWNEIQVKVFSLNYNYFVVVYSNYLSWK